MNDEEILKHARALVSQHGEDAAFRSTCIAMERCACAGDRTGMEQHSKVLLAMCDMMGGKSTVH